MIITDSFVYLNYPKTGSTFVRKALKELYEKHPGGFWKFSRRSLDMYDAPNRRISRGESANQPTPHGTYWQIPAKCKHLPIFSSFRDPRRRIVSLYHYGNWRKPKAWRAEIEEIREAFPRFPDLSLEEFLRYRRAFQRRKLIVGDEEFGPWVSDFVHFFLASETDADRNPMVFSSMDQLRAALGHVTFLRCESLNRELVDLLLEKGFRNREVDFIRRKDRVNVSAPSSSEQTAVDLNSVAASAERRELSVIHDLIDGRRLAFFTPEGG